MSRELFVLEPLEESLAMLVAWLRRFGKNQTGPLPRHTRLSVEPLEMRAVPATIIVTGTGDTIAVDGLVTLREAITAANTNAVSGDAPAGSAGLDTINFNIAGASGTVHTISPTSALPTITEALTINGYSQLGATQNTAAVGSNAILTIELNGASAGFNSGLSISGGGTTIQGLIINRFTNEGILVFTGGNNIIRGNFIGTDSTGKLDRGNGTSGIALASSNNTVGGTALADRNLIAGNDFHGVSVFTAGVTGNTIRGNLIGTDSTGGAALGNAGAGIRILNVQNTTVGGTQSGDGNVIAFNSGDGIDVSSTAGAGQAFLGNSIHSNGGLGIDLNSDGVTANDPLDPDSGPNGLQNFPVITSASAGNAGVVIAGSLQAAASTTYRIELFASAAADPTGFGEGQTFLAFVSVTTDGAGNATFNFSLATILPVGTWITATATDSGQNTSEFSQALASVPTAASAVNIAGTLTVTGTAFADSIIIDTRPANTSQIRVRVNGITLGVFSKAGVQRVAAYGLAGSDTITIGATLVKPAELHGNAGNDRLNGGSVADRLFGEEDNDLLFGLGGRDLLDGGAGLDRLEGQGGNDIVLGGAGSDSLFGNEGRDILIGGEGTDNLNGAAGDDILIGGTTSHDANATALFAILNEWSRIVPRGTRITKLKNGGGLNGSAVLTAGGTVLADGAVDRLTSGTGQDWFFRAIADSDLLLDATASDRVESF
jgi:Ca2+-binding RTX toxin-like protein